MPVRDLQRRGGKASVESPGNDAAWGWFRASSPLHGLDAQSVLVSLEATEAGPRVSGRRWRRPEANPPWLIVTHHVLCEPASVGGVHANVVLCATKQRTQPHRQAR